MENTIHSLEDLFKLCAFCIPQYQRAYTWEADRHISVFLADIRQQVAARRHNEDKTYFLGTLLLHDPKEGHIHIVDGQQRLSTSVILVAAALQKSKSSDLFPNKRVSAKKLHRDFIYDDVEELQKFRTITEDDPFFRAHILGLTNAQVSEASPSSKRLKEAFDYFLNNIADHEWEDLIHTLITAQVMVYAVDNPADATLIFELQNDRGKKLTDLESLKSYLMHLVYLHAKNPDDSLREIQTQFSKIYRNVEKLDSTMKAPDEDAVLAYHCAAYLKWTSEEWRRPKDLIKQTIKDLPGKDVTAWVLSFVAALHETYKAFVTLLSMLDDYTPLAELVVLDRMATFWPLVIKAYALDKAPAKSDFKLACRLMEVYAMRGFGMSNLRSDAGLPTLYRQARDFSGVFKSLHGFLHTISYQHDIPRRFENGLDSPALYDNNRRDAQYLLWRYENHLRSQPGKQVGHLPLRQYLFQADKAKKLSIEHIAAQNNPVSDTEVEWEEKDPKELSPFREVALHRLGNLVLDSISANSSKGKYDFTDKLESLSKNSTFLSQGELIDWAVKKEGGVYEWTVESVRNRHAHMKRFALKTWNPDNYFKPSPEACIEALEMSCEAGMEELIGE